MGGVGTFAVQVARASGTYVPGVYRTRTVGLARSLGRIALLMTRARTSSA